MRREAAVAPRWIGATKAHCSSAVSSFRGPFPEAATFRIEIPDGLTDETGRPLANANQFPLQVKTAEFPPLAKFAARFGIVEWKADPTLPVTLRNLEPEVRTRLLHVAEAVADKTPDLPDAQTRSLEGSYTCLPISRKTSWRGCARWRRQHATRSIFGTRQISLSVKSFNLPKPHEAQPLEVVGIPLEAPGLYIVEIESPRLGASLLGKPQSMFVPTSVLVTNLSVHFKWGREASLIWVTTLDEGRPVPDSPGGSARLYGQDAVGWTDRRPGDRTCREAPTPGSACRMSLRGQPVPLRLPTDDGHQSPGWRVVRDRNLANDFSFVHTSWDRGIEPWRFQLPLANAREAIIAHTVLDRSLLRAGDTVSYETHPAGADAARVFQRAR